MKADFEKGTKVCSRCKRELPVSEFNKDKSKNDGLNYYCRKCITECDKEYYNKRRKAIKEKRDKTRNTFGRVGCKRGNTGIVKRDYELTEQQLERRNKNRETQKYKTKRMSPQGVLIWYDGKLDNMTSEHFLFDFDLEQMLKDNVYYKCWKHNIYIEKWWDGTIKHWTVNDGIWKNKR